MSIPASSHWLVFLHWRSFSLIFVMGIVHQLLYFILVFIEELSTGEESPPYNTDSEPLSLCFLVSLLCLHWYRSLKASTNLSHKTTKCCDSGCTRQQSFSGLNSRPEKSYVITQGEMIKGCCYSTPGKGSTQYICANRQEDIVTQSYSLV